MLRNTLMLLISSLLSLANAAYAQPGPQWFGTWKSLDNDTTMTISASRIDHVFVGPDDKGKLETFKYAHTWTNRSDDAAGELERVFGYSKKRASPSDISKHYEAALRQYRKDPVDFSVSDPDKSRQAIRTIPPGIYRVLWDYSGGDCGYNEYIIDGDRLLEVNECKYRYKVRLFNRVK